MSMIQMKKSRAMKECGKARIPAVAVETVIFLAIFIGVHSFGTSPFIPLGRILLKGKDGISSYIISITLSNLAFSEFILIPFLYCRFIEKRSLASMGFYGSIGKSVITGLGVGLGLTVLVAGLQILLGAGTIAWSGALTVPTGIIFFLGTFLQSSGEEVFCRGYFMNSLGGRHSWPFAVVVNSVLFGLLHLLNSGVSILAIANVTIAGILFSLIAIRYNLWVSCAVHAMWNFSEGFIFGSNISGGEVGLSVFSISPAKGPEWLTGGSFGIEGSVVVTVLYIIAIVLLLLLPMSSEK